MRSCIIIILLFSIFHLQINAQSIIAVSILPQKYFVDRIGGKYVDVIEMIPAGSTPHTFEFSIQTLRKLSHCKAYFFLGHKKLVFEKQIIQKIRSHNNSIEFVNSSEGMNHIEDDTHIWTSPSSVRVMCQNMTNALCNLDPEHSTYFQQNHHQLLSEINDADIFIKNTLKKDANKYFMVFHPAWGYFARDYGLRQLALEHHGKEPSTYQLMKLIKKAKLLHINVIFVQPHFSAAAAEQMAQQIGAQIIRIDPLAYNWLENMKTIALNFKKAFQIDE